jgi:hypothetical protein
VEFDRTLVHMKTEDGLAQTPLHLATKSSNHQFMKSLINEYDVPVVV